MKNLGKLFGIISLVAIIVWAMVSCEANPESGSTSNQTPVAGDFIIGNLTQPAGNITAVTITPKAGKSGGAITIYYAGTGSTTYEKSSTIPATGTSGSTYAVTFDVAAATGWNAAKGLSAGVLTIDDSASTQTPVAGDYIFTNMIQTADNVTDAGITPKEGKSYGLRTIYYAGTDGTTYEKSQTPPQATGKYAVTFNVAATSGWNNAYSLSAGNLEVNTKQTPAKSDYIISENLTQTLSSITDVYVRVKYFKSPGDVTVYYEGVSGTIYDKSSTLPTAVGKYTVTFNVAATSYWNPATFVVGTLTVNSANLTPVESDYEIRNLVQYVGSVTPVIITPKPGKSTGAITIYYSGIEGTAYAKSVKLPSAVGKYAVTFDVAAVTGWDDEEDIDPEMALIINQGTPVASDYILSNLMQKAGSVTAVSIIPKEGKSDGTVSNIKYNDNVVIPQAAGTYDITFNVAESTDQNWKAVNGLKAASKLTITDG